MSNLMKHFAVMFNVNLHEPFEIKEKPNYHYMITDTCVMVNDGSSDEWKEVSDNFKFFEKLCSYEYNIKERDEDLKSLDLCKEFKVKENQDFILVDMESFSGRVLKIKNNVLYSRYRYMNNAPYRQVQDVDLYYAKDSIINTLRAGDTKARLIETVCCLNSSTDRQELIIEREGASELYNLSIESDVNGATTILLTKAEMETLAKSLKKYSSSFSFSFF